jgi:hypothetical protein
LLLDDIEFNVVSYEIEKLKQAKTESIFTSLSVDLVRELIQYTLVVSGVYKNDEDNNPRLWNRNDGILGGLMVRITKLMNEFLESFCKNQVQITEILTRSLVESVINLLYLLRFVFVN